MVSPFVTSAERRSELEAEARQNATAAALDAIYRSERGWRKLACGASVLGAVAIALDYRATAVVLLVLSILCQVISWAAMRTARRIHDHQMGVL